MLRTIIIDDEKQARVILREELSLFKEIEIIDEAESVDDAVRKILNHKPDLVFLDIHLGQGNGFDVLNKVAGNNFKVVFATAYDQYAVQAFKYNTLHYILKPIHKKDLLEVITKLNTATTELEIIRQKVNLIRNNRIAIQTGEGISFHDISSIIRCQSDSNYTLIFFSNEPKLLTARTLRDFEELLTTVGFERVHNSHLVNLAHVKKYSNKDGGHLVMSDNTIVPVSQRKKSQFLKLFSE